MPDDTGTTTDPKDPNTKPAFDTRNPLPNPNDSTDPTETKTPDPKPGFKTQNSPR